MAQVPQVPFFFRNYVKNWDVTLQFGRDISFVALVMIEKVWDLHLSWKLVPRPIQATSPKYRERLFSSVTKSNIEM